MNTESIQQFDNITIKNCSQNALGEVMSKNIFGGRKTDKKKQLNKITIKQFI